MADFASLQFEMERRSILFTANTTMPDNSLLGFEGNPNTIISPSTPGETLIYNSPQGTHYLELISGTLWFKSAMQNVWTSSSQAGTSGQITGYATEYDLAITGQALNTKIDNLSGYFNDQDVLAYTAELESGQESAFLPYPTVLSQPPSSITCAFQNNIDNIIYNYSLRQINTSGFYINFSDVLTNSGYLLKIQVKK